MKPWISTIVAGLVCLLAAQVAVTPAATDTSDAGSSAALRGRVVIDCEGILGTAPPRAPGGPGARGRCAISEAITDRGKFVDSAHLRVHPHVRIFLGAKGTIWFSVYLERGHWEITDGTKAYAGLRGRGWERNSGRCPNEGGACRISLTMTGTVSTPVAGSRLAGTAQGDSRIAFISGTGLYVVNADGSRQRSLARDARAVTPAWSPDGQRIAFVTQALDEAREISVVNADGGEVENLTRNPGPDDAPAWSPDGRKIAFERFNRHPEIYVMNADGSGQRNLSRHPAGDVNPVWSPDGRKVAFVRRISFVGPPRVGGPPGLNILYRNYLYVVNADGSGLRQLAPEAVCGDLSPDWSPDGRTIRCGHSLVQVDGSGLRSLPRVIPWNGAWSPDGQKIAFTQSFPPGSHGSPRMQYDIFVMNADGSGQRRLTRSPGGDGSPAWSPDGRKIAFISHRDGNVEIYVMNADGSGQRRLTNSPEPERWFAWSPGQGR